MFDWEAKRFDAFVFEIFYEFVEGFVWAEAHYRIELAAIEKFCQQKHLELSASGEGSVSKEEDIFLFVLKNHGAKYTGISLGFECRGVDKRRLKCLNSRL